MKCFMQSKLITCILVFSVFVVSFGMIFPMAVQAEEPVYGGSITITYESDFVSLDPPKQWNYPDYMVIFAVYNRLLRYERGNPEAVEPDLAAEMPDVNEDATEYTFRIREGVRFHNGREVTAHDVKATYERYFHPDTAAYGVDFFRMVEGWEEYRAGEADEVKGIQVLDDYTVRFELNTPAVQFPYLTATPWASILPIEEVESRGANFGVDPVGSGPFRVEEYRRGEKITLVRNEDYFRDDEPYLDEVVIDIGVDPSVAVMRWELEEADLLYDRLPPADFLRVIQTPELEEQVLSGPLNNVVYLVLNVVDEELQDVRVRRAIAHAIDKERILQTINFRGEKAKGYFPPPAPVHNPDIDYYEYDPDRARELLAEAGYPDGFSWNLVIRQGWPYSPETMALSVQADLEAVGIQTTLEPLMIAPLIERQENDAVPHFNHWPMEFPDPSATVDAAFRSDGSWNFWGYDDPEMDAKLDAAREATDEENKYDLYMEIDQMMLDRAWFIPIYYPIDFVPHSSKIGGLEIPANDSAYRLFRIWSKTGE